MNTKAEQCKEEIKEATDLWTASCKTGEPSPEIMRETSTAGFYVAGIPPTHSEEEILTWPNPDLYSTLSAADALHAQGHREVIIYEDDFGIPLEDLTKSIRCEILEALAASGGEATLMELMEEHLEEDAFLYE